MTEKNYYKKYTLIFAVMAALVFCGFWLNGRTFIFTGDGWNQHFKALVYYAKYLREMARSLVGGHFIWPEWDYAVGEGNDILATFHYYAMGDPFYLPAVFVPTRFMHYYYDFAVIARLCVSGLVFSKLCFYVGRRSGGFSQRAVLAGSLVYIFCTWNMVNVCKHVYFLNTMVFFPLLILGVELLIEEKKAWVFVIAVALSAASNFYFFYMLVLMTVLYVVIRFAFAYGREVRAWLTGVARLLLWGVIGCCLAAAALLPILITFLGDARMDVENAHHLFYPLSYYSYLPALFVSSGHETWLCMGFAPPTLMALFLLFKKKENKTVKTCLIAGLIMMLLPIFGQALNGFSYITNRWSWALALPAALAVVLMWENMMSLDGREAMQGLIVLAAFFAACMIFDYSRESRAFAALFICLLFWCVMMPVQMRGHRLRRHLKENLALMLIAAGIFSNAFWLYADVGEGSETLQKTVMGEGLAERFMRNEAAVVADQAADDGLAPWTYRMSGRGPAKNANIFSHVSSTQFYWTISNPYVSEFRTAVEVREPKLHSFIGYNGRAALLALTGVKYYASPARYHEEVPHGFAKGRVRRGYRISKNPNALPMVYGYTKVMPRSKWDQLPAVDKEQAMLDAAVLEDGAAALSNGEGMAPAQADYDGTSHEIGYTFGRARGLKVRKNSFKVKKAGASVVLRLDAGDTAAVSGETSELYVRIKGLDFTYTHPYYLVGKGAWKKMTVQERAALIKDRIMTRDDGTATIRLKTSEKAQSRIEYVSKEFKHYGGRHDFTVNLGSTDGGVTYIRLIFDKTGVYSFNDISVCAQPMDDLAEKVQALQAQAAENISFDTDTVSADYTAAEKTVLCFAVPYAKGWSALVDGQEAQLERVNVRNMGVVLEAGSHHVQLIYRTPGLRAGVVVTFLTALALIAGKLALRRRKRPQSSRE